MKRKIESKDKLYPTLAKELEIVLYPHPKLKKVSDKVTQFGSGLKELCQNMLKTMYHAPGIGLAAPQIGINERIFVCDVNYDREIIGGKKKAKRKSDSSSNDENEIDDEDIQDELPLDKQVMKLFDLDPLIFINPVIMEREGHTTYEEGCLSIPGIFDKIERSKNLVVRYQDIKGKYHEMQMDDLLAICFQHELDHLDGILFIERLTADKFAMQKNKYLEMIKNTGK